MKRSMLPEETWQHIGMALDAVDGDGRAFIRVLRKSLPAHALGFVMGGAS